MKRLLTLLIAATLLVSMLGSAQSVNRDTNKENARSRIDSAIIKLLEQANAASGKAIQTARALGVPFDGNTVTLTLVLNNRALAASNPAYSNAVTQAFGSANVIAARSNTFMRLRVPIGLLPLIEFLLTLVPDIAYIRPPLAPQTLAISEGVSLIGADDFQQSTGSSGQGAKIAVIDLGFSGLSSARARGELPGNVITRDFTGSGLEFGTNHGTAVAEIVHDVAPGAQLYLWKIGDEIDLENAVSEAIAQGIDIVNHSVGWFNTSYYDGTGVIADIVRTATNAGILWVNSAGNYAERHYKGVFRDNNGNGWMEFNGSDESINIQASAGETIQLFLTWRDWPFTGQDYDLVLYNSGGQQVAISDKTQNGAQEPTESLRYFVPSSGSYRVQIQRFSGSSAKDMTLFSLFHDIEHAVAQSSIVTPADVSNVLSVAAIRQENWNSGPVSAYSSQGPTTDGRAKPDITGPDNVSNSTLGRFEGTSAAAPHVAGAAALLLSQNPALSASQLSSQLRNSASAIGSPLATGSGRLQLQSSQPATRADLMIFNTDFTPRNPNIGETVRHTVTVRNQGNAASGAFTVLFQDQSGSQQQLAPSLPAGATTTLTFSRTITVATDNITITVDSGNQVAESNENNNTAQYSVSGQTPPPSGNPDLIVESITFTPQNPTVGGALQLSFVVRNQGNALAGAFRVELQGGTTVNAQTVNGLSADASVSLNVNTTLSRAGQTFTAVADAQNQVPESNENNNTRSVTVNGSTPPPSNSPQGSIKTDKSSYQLGEAVTITMTTDMRAYLYVYNVDSDGSASLVFPNGFSSNNLINAGSYILPDGNYRFTVTGPLGTESLHLLLTLQPVSLGLSGAQNPNYATPSVFAAELQNQARSRLGNSGWSTTSTSFQVGAGQSANQRPQASFTYAPAAPQPGQQVTFDASASSDPDGQIAQYQWDFDGNGSPDAFGVRVSRSFGAAGNFPVALTVTDQQGASATSSQTVEVRSVSANQPPVAQFNFSPNRPALGQTVIFDATSSFDLDGFIVEYQWDLNTDGRIDSRSARVSARFNTARTYTATLTVVDNQGASHSVQQSVVVGNSAPSTPAPVASFTYSPSNPVAGQLITVDASASTGDIVEYQWRFDSNSTNTGVRSSVTYSTPRTAQITLTVRDANGRTDSQTRSIQIAQAAPSGPTLAARFTHSPSNPVAGQLITFDASTSTGNIVEYRWEFDGDNVFDTTGVTASAQFPTPRTAQVTLVVVDASGRTDNVTQSVQISPAGNRTPQAQFTFSPNNPLPGQQVTFDASGSSDPDGSLVDFRWDFNSDGQVDAVGVQVRAQFNTAGTFRVTLTVLDNSGLSASASQNMVVGGAGAPSVASPPAPAQAGKPRIYIFGEATRLRVVVVGDPAWGNQREFRIAFTANANFGQVTHQAHGQATSSVNSTGSQINGTVGNGWAEFVINQRSLLTMLTVWAYFDLNGDGNRERTQEVYIVVGDRSYQASQAPFALVSSTFGDTPILPFEDRTLYTCSDRLTRCERVGS